MKKLLYVSLIIVGGAPASFSQEIDREELRKVIEKGVAAAARAKRLTPADVPAEARTRVETTTRGQLVLKTYYRGERRVLKIVWSDDAGQKEHSFVATIYDGEHSVGKFSHYGSSTSILSPDAENGYEFTTTVGDNKSVSITVWKNNEFLDEIEVAGRKSKPIDELKYTKWLIEIQGLAKPLIDAVNKQPKKTEQDVAPKR